MGNATGAGSAICRCTCRADADPTSLVAEVSCGDSSIARCTADALLIAGESEATPGTVGNGVGVEVARVSAVELESGASAIGEEKSEAGCDATGELVSEIDSVTLTAVSSIGMTCDVGLSGGIDSISSGPLEATTTWRDAGCGAIAWFAIPPRALTGENGGITAGCGVAEVGADSGGTASPDSGGFVSAAGISND